MSHKLVGIDMFSFFFENRDINQEKNLSRINHLIRGLSNAFHERSMFRNDILLLRRVNFFEISTRVSISILYKY